MARLLALFFICLTSLVLVQIPSVGSSSDALGQGPVELDYAKRDDVRAFVKELVKENAFNEKELLELFHQVEYKQNIIDAISRPAERTLNWAEYQDIFLTNNRRDKGIKFIYDNEAALRKAYEVYGVPPVVVTAIIGVETQYGGFTGRYRALDALSTLAFDYPPRAGFFRSELKELMLLAREEGRVITDLTGSYAGAMGLGQFIPSSYRRYAVDFDKDGLRDVWENPTDAIGSVANYLHEHGWRRDEMITYPVESARVPAEIFNVSLKPSITIKALAAYGMNVNGNGSTKEDEMVSPMKLEGKHGDEYWLGLHNFYVITRYNHSKLYAMAVFQLSENLREGGSEFAKK